MIYEAKYIDRSTPYGYRTYDVQTQQRPNDQSYSVGLSMIYVPHVHALLRKYNYTYDKNHAQSYNHR